MKSLILPYQQDKLEFIKNPTVAEFIGLSPNTDFTESKLESAIISNLQRFLLELGKGFSYVTRQKLVRSEGDNSTIGIVLCSETDEDIARYSVLHDNNQLFASKYMLYMPTEDELRNEIERQKEFFRLQHTEKSVEE